MTNITLNFVLILSWNTSEGRVYKGYEKREIEQFCAEAEKHKDVELLKIASLPGSTRYGFTCNGFDCTTPPDEVVIEKITCNRIPENRREVVVPRQWEIK